MSAGHHCRALVFLAALLHSTVAASPAVGEVDVSAVAPPVFTLGEPVVVSLSIRNRTADRVDIDLGADFVTNIAVTTSAPDGSVSKTRVPVSEGIARIGRVSIGAGETYTQEMLLNQWVDFRRTGVYEFAIRPVGNARTESGRTVTLPAAVTRLTIVERDEPTLRATCERLARTILTASDVERRMAAARQLAAIRDPVVVGFIRHIMHESQRADASLIEALREIGNAEAIDALRWAAHDGQNDERAALARNALQRLRRDPARR